MRIYVLDHSLEVMVTGEGHWVGSRSGQSVSRYVPSIVMLRPDSTDVGLLNASLVPASLTMLDFWARNPTGSEVVEGSTLMGPPLTTRVVSRTVTVSRRTSTTRVACNVAGCSSRLCVEDGSATGSPGSSSADKLKAPTTAAATTTTAPRTNSEGTVRDGFGARCRPR